MTEELMHITFSVDLSISIIGGPVNNNWLPQEGQKAIPTETSFPHPGQNDMLSTNNIYA